MQNMFARRLRKGEELLSHTRSWHIWCTVFHARQKRIVSLMFASRLTARASSSILGDVEENPGVGVYHFCRGVGAKIGEERMRLW